MTRRKREIVGLTNERDFPHLVELALPPGGFRSVFLEIDSNWQAMAFSPETQGAAYRIDWPCRGRLPLKGNGPRALSKK